MRAGEQKKIVSISSSHGSVTVPPLVEGAFWYGMSKAALNKTMATLSYVLKVEGITVVLLHPGAVLTEKQAHLEFPGMIATIAGLTIADTGKFLQYDGSPQPW